ncbi:hypothetical protein AOA80_06270 [Methanomassiliicoccales archaeon RumEn M1]|nr:hypothetical protein AOA80_06270 [Methanomassiliicoccales archaeon RumEn M1]
MDSHTLLLVVSVALFVGFAANYMFVKFKAPDVLLLITFGVLLGPGVLGVINEGAASQITQLTTYVAAVALSVIMLQAGMDLKLKDVVKSFNHALIFTLVAFFVSIGVISLVCKLSLGWTWGEALLLGSILGGTSGAIVIPLVKVLNVSGKVKTIVTLEAALTDVLVIAGAMTIMAIIAAGGADLADVGMDILMAFLFSAVLGVVGGVIWLNVLKHTGQSLSYMITLAFMLLLFSISELTVGLGGGAIAALMFGLTMGNSDSLPSAIRRRLDYCCDPRIIDFHDEISFFVRTFFFIYLGLVLSLTALSPVEVLAGVVVFNVVVIGRIAVSASVGKLMCKDRKDRVTLLFMMPRGLAAAVVASLPLSLGVVSTQVGNMIGSITAAVILLTTCLASIGAYVIEKRAGRSELPCDCTIGEMDATL